MKKEVVILAAGIGSRLRPLTNNIPKSMVEVAGTPLLERLLTQINKYKSTSTNINVVVGYCSESIINLTNTLFNEVKIISNPKYDSTNNMYSLKLALDCIDNDSSIVIINADCIYDDHIVDVMLNLSRDSIAIDKNLFSDESMKVMLDDNSFIHSMSKLLNKNDKTFVSMDIYFFINSTFINLHKVINQIISNDDLNSWTEVAIDLTSRLEGVNISTVSFDDKWVEIDNKDDLELANNLFN